MTRLVLACLDRIGANARTLIACAPFVAILLSDLSALLRPALPFLVAAVYASAMLRIDLGNALLAALKLKSFVRTCALILVLMVAIPCISLALSKAAGLSQDAQQALVYAALAPPFASAPAICFLIGGNAALALELSVLSALLAPIVGATLASFLLGDTLPLDPFSLSSRIALMIGAGALFALAVRKAIGPARITQNSRALDGVTAIIMIVFVVPVFDGVADMVLSAPWTALEVFFLVIVANLAVQVVLLFGLAPLLGSATAASIAISTGNRNVSLYLAALPTNAYLTLFVALYQIPMYLTPVIARRAMKLMTPKCNSNSN
ncbi:MAG: hypothetical protein ACR2PG_03890, partial [Hyphomicrobiaceae bacterium]